MNLGCVKNWSAIASMWNHVQQFPVPRGCELNCEELTKAWEDTGEPLVLRRQILYFILIYQKWNAGDGFLVPLRVTRSESVSTKILLILHNLHILDQSFANITLFQSGFERRRKMKLQKNCETHKMSFAIFLFLILFHYTCMFFTFLIIIDSDKQNISSVLQQWFRIFFLLYLAECCLHILIPF